MTDEVVVLPIQSPVLDAPINENRECIACLKTKPLNAFIRNENRKNTNGTSYVYTKVRRVCSACLMRKYREGIKAELALDDNNIKK